jgi:hypothetical protein
MSRGDFGGSVGAPLMAARFILLMIKRHTTTHPIETTIRRTQAIVRVGSVRNSRNGRSAANVR